MCGPCAPDGADGFALVAAAREAADELLGRLGVPVAKALDLSSPRGFDRAVVAFADELRRQAAPADVEALRAAVAVLDVDWRRTTPEGRRRLVAEATARAARATEGVPRSLEATFGRAAERVVGAMRGELRRRQGLAVAADFNAVDRRVVAYARTSQTGFVRDAYGRRHAALSAEARRLVAEGLAQGLGQGDLAETLAGAARRHLVERARPYWDLVASAFVGNARAYGQVSAYAEAGVERYVLRAVLDEVTTPQCRFLDGKVFAVRDALARFERLESAEAPEAIVDLRPWLREGPDPDGGGRRLYVRRGGERVTVARVVRSGAGARDDRGAFAGDPGERALSGFGLDLPPFHAHCRTTTTPA
ncbi:MAG TPA: minor capsid protein [Polyangiaceae bacterium]|nr:minor capsid protein [Polyangiaceae bacterium]